MVVFYFIFLIYFGLHWVFVASRRLFLVVSNEGYSIAAACGPLIVVAFGAEHGLWERVLQQLHIPGPRAQAQSLWRMALAFP